jgi:nuclear transport factor 2 (NTF2) superfamily protein
MCIACPLIFNACRLPAYAAPRTLRTSPATDPAGIRARESTAVGIDKLTELKWLKEKKIMATAPMVTRPPFPPFTRESAIQKVRLAEDGWNSRDPGKVALVYAMDSRWRNRSEFVNGRNEIIAFLTGKWAKELDYRLIKELWAFTGNRIAVRFAYEWHDDSGNWCRSYGNENWEFNDDGLMAFRFASINDLPILESDRKYHWPLGRRPDDHPGLSDLGL